MLRLICLSDEFYARYGHYEEVLKKDGRPYACLAVEIDGYKFAIPFRHHIAHKYAFITYDRCGLDYTKAVVIENDIMISPELPTIEQREHDALKGKDALITAGMRRYYKTLRKAMQYADNPHYENILRFSALKYFLQ